MADRYQEAQRRLNLVKAHAHEIVGVKREQVHRVVENLGSPGTYDITVHENGRVYTQKWTAPEPVVEWEVEYVPEAEVPVVADEELLATWVEEPAVAVPFEVVSESADGAEVPVPVRGRGRPKKSA